ncbi:hypothetical protein [Desulfolutivibrio sulfoxidireducens]|uniref:hypothetical protein n=1 Tax=Desulfolutivibrio sulfoxidireducens TaxID=2773299 RepID=UPI00159E65E0|nr:hypothetical protein [Desulfolutivibrio sulfoxidireducens]QLA16776.1 hypothetical protein GD605_12085 [Desulfolutivibrio sulfoxidireducens]QLA20341.1 hypothetical protein GD604_11795 [Desulfolutivibrio sulfoxidireducens]
MRRVFFAVVVWLLATAQAVAGQWGAGFENGRAWLVEPGGGRFYSLGVNTVNGGQEHPKGQGYYWKDFYGSMDAWAADVGKRLAGWGFNTRGGWSDPAPGVGLPLIPEIDLGRNARLHWFDPFAPDALEATIETAKRVTGKYKGNPDVMGYFTDNEVGWWNAPLFSWYLSNEWAIYTKQVLWRLLFEQYHGRWERLRADFVPGEGMGSFEDLKKGGARLKLRPGGHGIKVVDAFTRLCAGRYYELARAALREVDPDRLVMGDRLPLYYHQDAVLAARGKVDVLSTNYNVDEADGWVAPYYFEGLSKLIDAPVLITEYFFAAQENRSGNKNNGHLMHVATQDERARGAAAAQANFAAFPNVVGAHWFQYYDEPTGGRGDGEDFNMGLVDIANRPYERLAQAMGTVNARAATIHAQSRFDTVLDKAAPVHVRRLPRPADCGDNSLLDWPEKAATRLLGFETKRPYAPFGDVHVAWSPEGLSLFNLAGNYVDLFLLDYQGEFPLSETYQIHVILKVGGQERHFAAHLLPRPHSRYEGRFELEPRLYEVAGDGSYHRLDAAGLIQALDKPLPHVAVEFFLPARLLGVEKLAAEQKIEARVFVTNFYRELTMTYDGGPVSFLARDANTRLPRTFVLLD